MKQRLNDALVAITKIEMFLDKLEIDETEYPEIKELRKELSGSYFFFSDLASRVTLFVDRLVGCDEAYNTELA